LRNTDERIWLVETRDAAIASARCRARPRIQLEYTDGLARASPSGWSLLRLGNPLDGVRSACGETLRCEIRAPGPRHVGIECHSRTDGVGAVVAGIPGSADPALSLRWSWPDDWLAERGRTALNTSRLACGLIQQLFLPTCSNVGVEFLMRQFGSLTTTRSCGILCIVYSIPKIKWVTHTGASCRH